MNPILKPSLVIAVAAGLASAPLVALMHDTVRDQPAAVAALLHGSPLLIGATAVLWYRALHARGQGVAAGARLGILTAFGSFFTFIAGFSPKVLSFATATPVMAPFNSLRMLSVCRSRISIFSRAFLLLVVT